MRNAVCQERLGNAWGMWFALDGNREYMKVLNRWNEDLKGYWIRRDVLYRDSPFPFHCVNVYGNPGHEDSWVNQVLNRSHRMVSPSELKDVGLNQSTLWSPESHDDARDGSKMWVPE